VTRRLPWTHFLAAVVILGVVARPSAAPASASTAQLVDVVLPPECKSPSPPGICPPRAARVIVYQAGSGEANRVSVVSSPQELRIRDRAAVIQVGRGCTQIDRHRVKCPVPEDVFIDTSGGADRVRSRSASITANGGRGDDVLVGGPSGDKLFGGRGADFIRGRGGDDRLYDAAPRRPLGSSDLSQFFPPPFEGLTFGPTPVPLASSARGRDSFDGGIGHDTISYEGRLAGVNVDLANGAAVAGANDEHDSVERVESVLGGAGDDRLAGNSRTNELDGTKGDDRILGRRGTDFIEGGSGRNLILAGPGEDYIDGVYRSSDFGPERIFCGSGLDHVSWIFPSDFVNDDCETMEFTFLGEGALFGGGVKSLLPIRTGNPPTVLVTSELWCSAGLNPSGCQLTLELRVLGPAGRRGTAPPRGTSLGYQTYTFSPDERKSVSLGVSPEGLQILRRHRALRVLVSALEGSPPPPVGYMTVLRAPSRR
jgi:Ca2+-binding RTX toxin-like protein